MQRDGFSVEAAERKGRSLPQWFLDQPEVPEGGETDFIFAAFEDLATCRNEAGSIPWSEARLYALHYGLDANAFAQFWLIVKAMDAAERNWFANHGSEGEASANLSDRR